MAQLLEEHEAAIAAGTLKAVAGQPPATSQGSAGASGKQAKDAAQALKDTKLARIAELEHSIAATEGLTCPSLAPVVAGWKAERDSIRAGLKNSKPVHQRLREATAARDKAVVSIRTIQHELEKISRFAAVRTTQLRQYEAELVTREEEVRRLLVEQN